MLYTEKIPKQGFLRSIDLTLFASTWGSCGARGPLPMTFFFAMTPVGFIRTQRKFFWLFLKCYWALLNSIWIFLPAPVTGCSQIWVCSFNRISCSAAQIFKFQSFLLQKLLTVAILYIRLNLMTDASLCCICQTETRNSVVVIKQNFAGYGIRREYAQSLKDGQK